MDSFEWDVAKAESNLRKHGVSFHDAARAIMGPAILDRSQRGDEPRFRSICRSGERVIVVIWTPRQDAIRIISARPANSYEKAEYREGLRDGLES